MIQVLKQLQIACIMWVLSPGQALASRAAACPVLCRGCGVCGGGGDRTLLSGTCCPVQHDTVLCPCKGSNKCPMRCKGGPRKKAVHHHHAMVCVEELLGGGAVRAAGGGAERSA